MSESEGGTTERADRKACGDCHHHVFNVSVASLYLLRWAKRIISMWAKRTISERSETIYGATEGSGGIFKHLHRTIITIIVQWSYKPMKWRLFVLLETWFWTRCQRKLEQLTIRNPVKYFYILFLLARTFSPHLIKISQPCAVYFRNLFVSPRYYINNQSHYIDRLTAWIDKIKSLYDKRLLRYLFNVLICLRY